MNLRSSLLAISMLGGLVGLGGCAVPPGQYVIIRLASAQTTQSDSCYPDNMVPDSIRDDRTDISTGDSVAIFAADSETYFLEYGDGAISIEGSRDGKDYDFQGETVDVEETQTSTLSYDVQLNISGKSVSGTSVETVTTTCTSDNCENSSCVRTTEFVGTIVKGVDLEHAI